MKIEYGHEALRRELFGMAEHIEMVCVKPLIEQVHDCLHDQCQECHGTGQKRVGGSCVHHVSCPCPKHSVWC